MTISSATKYVLTCMLCGFDMPPALVHRCPRCAGAMEPRLSLVDAALRRSDDPERTYFDFLPVESEDLLDAGTTRHTPCRPAPRLGARIGVPGLWIKDESRQPTGTTKDRLAALVLAVLRRFGVTEFVTASTGNTATALARAVRRDGSIRAHFFCGRDFVRHHRFEPDALVRLVVVDGGYAQAGAEALRFAERHDLHWEGGFFNWARREGAKLAYLEAFDSMPRQPDVIVQAVSSGLGVVAGFKGAKEYLELGRLERIPRFLMTQQDTCAPMVTAWHAGRTELTESDVVTEPAGLASAILLGDCRPYYPYLANIAMASGGSFVAASQDELVEARGLLDELEGLDVCHSSAATIAAARHEAAAGRIDTDTVVLANLTGTARAAECVAMPGSR